MSNEEKFKHLLNDKLSEKEFEFEPAAWESAKALIDKKRQNRKGFYFIIPVALFILGGLGYFLMPESSKEPKAIALTVLENSKLKTPYQSNINLSDKSETQETKKTEIKNSEIVPSSLPNKQKDELVATPAANIQNDKPILKTEPTKELPIKTNVIELGIQNPMSSIATITSNSALTDNEQVTPIQNLNIQATLPIVQKEETKKSEEPINAATNFPIVINKEERISPNNPVATINTEPLEEKSIKQTSEILSANNPSNTIEQKQSLDTTNKNTVVTEIAVTNTIVPLPTSYLFLEAGTNYNLGWKNPGSTEANGFNPIVGILLHSNIYKKFGFTFGVQYSSSRNLNYSQHTSKITRYGLGEENDVTVITPATLHYIYIPLKLSYALKEKNIFTIGYNFGYLLNVESKVETYNEHFTYNDNYKKYTTGGYTEGFSIFDSQISAGYRRKLFKDFWMNAELFFGLSDVKNNTFFNLNVSEKNKGFKISLMYNIFKK